MFDYLRNKYNRSPVLFSEDDLDKDYLYVKYTEAPYLLLPKTLDAYKALHRKKFWYNLRRSEKLFQSEFSKLSFEVVKDGKELDFFLEQVFELFNERWVDEYTSATWKCKKGFYKYKKAMIELSSSGNAFLAVLYDKNRQLLSYGYCLEQDNTIFFYQHTTTVDSKYRKYSLGKVLIHHLLKYAVNNKYDKFDFMAGDSSYKYEWAKDTKIIYRSIGRKKISNYLKMYLVKMRYFLQFNYCSRRTLKLIWKYIERIFEKFNFSH